MKDNNLNISKNVENIDIYYKPEGQMTKPVYELLKDSKEGDYNSLKQLLDEKEFQESTLNLAFRNLIKELKIEKQNYFKCLKLLLTTNIDLNYKYVKENNNTILMMVFKKFEYVLIKEFLENIHFKKNDNYLNNAKMEEDEIKEIEKFFSQKDANNCNFFHLIDINCDKIELLNIFEYIYNKYPDYKSPGKPQKIQQIFKKLFLERNNDGNNVMNICLFHGLVIFVLKLIEINGYIPNVNNQKNNYIHCAILGKKMTSVKILLYYCNLEELNMKNSDMLTPAQLAYKMGYVVLSNLIIEYQKNFNEEEYKKHFYSTLAEYEQKLNNLPNDLLINFQNYNYKQLLYEVNELKIINSLVQDNSNPINNNIENEDEIIYKISYLKLEWNLLLIQIKMAENEYEKEYDNNSNLNKLRKNSKKKLKKIEDKNKNIFSPFLQSILNIFENIFTNKFISSYIDLINELKIKKINKEIEVHYINIEKNIDILIYNKIIFYFKYGYINSLLDTAQIYLTKIFNKDLIANKIQFILFVNISFILTETLIYQGLHNLAEIIIIAIDKYLCINYQEISQIDYTKNEIIIFNYLNQTGVINQFSPVLSHIFCYSNFMKLLISKDKIKEIFSNIKKNLENAQFSKEKTIFFRLCALNSYMEIKKLYEKEDDQIYNKISKLNNFGEEGEIYYFNTLGIIYMKKQKFYLSLVFFKKALFKYIQILKNKNIQNYQKEKLLNFRIDYITSLLYNISLCHFYLKNFSKCISILEQLLQFKNNQKNFFIFYRLALCYFQLYIIENNRHSDYYNENILKIFGYEKDKNKIKKSKNEKTLSIDLENEDGVDNLAYQFESEYKNNLNKNIYNSYNSDNNKSPNKYEKETTVGNNNLNIKKIILKNTTKLMSINRENNIFSNKSNIFNKDINKNNIFNKEINKNNNIKINYIDKAIKYFKKVILLSKVNTYSNSMKSLFNFYTSYNEDDKNSVNIDNFYKRKKIPNDLLISTYLNLLLCLSIKKNWPEMIFIIKDYNNKKIVSNKIITLKILLYKLEAYTNLRNTQKINETINKLKGYKKLELSLFNKANNKIINEINIKLYLYYTMTIIHLKEKNFKEIDINADKLLFLLKDEKNIPYYIIDLLINVYLIKLNNEPNLNEKNKCRYNNIILNLIKRKKTNFEK